MLFRLFLAFTIIPLVELALLIEVGSWLGLGPTIALVLTTGIVGAWLARAEGVRAVRAIQSEAGAGRVPGDELLNGLLILVAGVVLITPGVLTDLAGILLLVRPVRAGIVRRLKVSLGRSLKVAVVPPFGPLSSGNPPDFETSDSTSTSSPRTGRVIEL